MLNNSIINDPTHRFVKVYPRVFRTIDEARAMIQHPVYSIYRQDLFHGKVAIVTGGGTGIGRRTAHELALLGCTVAIASRKRKVLEETATVLNQDIQSKGSKGIIFPVVCNIRDHASIELCLDTILAKYGKIDYLVNNGGGQFPSPSDMMTVKGWQAVIDTNLTGTFFMSQYVYNKAFKNTNSGAIVNIIANMWNGFPMMVHTGAARSGVDNFTKTLVIEWSTSGVRVNAIAPGVIKSSGLDRYDAAFQDFIMGSAKFNYTTRLGTEEEIAAGIIFLLSPAAAFITGETLRIDGGEPYYNGLKPPEPHAHLPPFQDNKADQSWVHPDVTGTTSTPAPAASDAAVNSIKNKEQNQIKNRAKL